VVEGVPAHHVTEFVPEDHAHLFVIQQCDGSRVEHDERLVHPDRASIHQRRL
jgi:hypothetical protein